MACALFITRIGQVFQLLAGLAPALCGQLHLTSEVGGACVFVEQAAVGVGLEQRLVFMLAVNVDQQLAQSLEVALGAWRAIDVAARSAFGSDDAAQDARAIALKVAFGQPGPRFRNVLQIEGGQNVGFFSAGANHPVVCAVT